ncbi:LysR substrate-binding domain-containing protein [Methylobacterium durans]|uniref:LysR substrate-binding domain-containing protein n=1 Tax=Methylobacterium durans TaxID=2202825 RepID=UPI002AFF4C17|nr:LysR substrate-binding domain-containing protein [Methylobacterium durans]MEA1834669.1 LysR substrate-binding domain-containing protein [Methylobacterium durans]
MRTLDLDQLRAFLVATDLKSFTAAGTCLGATQSAISLRIARLEEQVGRRLLARTPRAVGLTPEGARLLPHARAILAAHDRAWAELADGERRTSLRLAVSDHAVGGHLAAALGSLRAALPRLVPDVTVGLSTAMRAAYDRGEAEVAVLRQEGERREGTPLFADALVWAAAPALDWSPGEPVPLVSLSGPCGVKAAAFQALEAAGLPWRHAFSGGSVTALQAAVRAGLGLAPFGARHLPEGCAARAEGLPPLPASRVVLLTRQDGRTRDILAAAFRAAGAPRERAAA